MKSILKGVHARKLKACPQDCNPLGLYGCDCYNYIFEFAQKVIAYVVLQFFLSTNQMLTDNNNNNNNNNKDNNYKDFINWI